MINKVTLIGNVGKDPESRSFDNGNAVCNFSLATNESYKDKAGEWQNKTEWHNISCWGKLAEICQKYVEKGNKVYVEGKITTRKWQDNQGNDRYTTEIVAHTVRGLDKKESAQASSGFPTPQVGQGINSSSQDDELPF